MWRARQQSLHQLKLEHSTPIEKDSGHLRSREGVKSPALLYHMWGFPDSNCRLPSLIRIKAWLGIKPQAVICLRSGKRAIYVVEVHLWSCCVSLINHEDDLKRYTSFHSLYTDGVECLQWTISVIFNVLYFFNFLFLCSVALFFSHCKVLFKGDKRWVQGRHRG